MDGQLKAFCVAQDGRGRRLSMTISNLDTEPLTIGKGPMVCMATQAGPTAPPKIECSVDSGTVCIQPHVCPADGEACTPTP